MRESYERLKLLLANIHPQDVDNPTKQETLAHIAHEMESLRAGIEMLEDELRHSEN